jgi:hypothetical protein
MRPVRRHDRHPDLGTPVPVQVSGLGRGHREPPAKLGHDGADHCALLLERVDVAQQQIEGKCPSPHRFVRRAAPGRGPGDGPLP